MSTSIGGVDSSSSESGENPKTVTLNDGRINSLRAAGYTDAQIEALLSMADPDDQGNSLTPTHFYSVNKQTLNSLRYTGQLDEASQKLVYLQAPVAMVQEVSNPANWNGDNYIGPGASQINAYLMGEPVDFTKPSLDALIMGVLTARADILQTQLEDQIESINQKNDLLEEANMYLAKAKEKKAAAGTSGTSMMTKDMVDFWKQMGAQTDRSGNDDSHNSAEWDANIEHLKSKIESLTSQSQLQTTKLQQTINKYNQTFEMLSNFINKYFQSISTIIQNMR
ncbi:hypothetical protein [Endozoicomonas sp. GU-1]|uniref:hypothetical protein n=1 Tax=Endozoicomonas sp. GU-1 TaxID=3009078 RepID=UPI0022B425B9|nr:hypothetical protein [Endozoicomonas sp. GU-1]WBA83000.1 hypothetical protein O2T12_07725 [Endozoicomonas sp. GU-1]WBA85923.1 hypothetical protein O3276_22355 [Endozoicomonas sp. GU-1]